MARFLCTKTRKVMEYNEIHDAPPCGKSECYTDCDHFVSSSRIVTTLREISSEKRSLGEWLRFVEEALPRDQLLVDILSVHAEKEAIWKSCYYDLKSRIQEVLNESL